VFAAKNFMHVQSKYFSHLCVPCFEVFFSIFKKGHTDFGVLNFHGVPMEFFQRHNISHYLRISRGLPGDGHDCAGACKCPQNDPWVVVLNSACKKKKYFFLNLKVS
jgi:hypothetical protein